MKNAAAAGHAVTVGRFAAVPSVMSQIDAQLYCEANYPAGGGLASIHTIAEHAAAVSACRALGPSTTWRGADEAGIPAGCCKYLYRCDSARSLMGM